MLIAASFTDVNFALAFWTAVTFALLLVVLGKFAWKPILETIETREKTIAEAIESAKRERAEAEKAAADMRASLEKARGEASEMIRRNQAEVAAAKNELMAAASRRSGEPRWRGCVRRWWTSPSRRREGSCRRRWTRRSSGSWWRSISRGCRRNGGPDRTLELARKSAS